MIAFIEPKTPCASPTMLCDTTRETIDEIVAAIARTRRHASKGEKLGPARAAPPKTTPQTRGAAPTAGSEGLRRAPKPPSETPSSTIGGDATAVAEACDLRVRGVSARRAQPDRLRQRRGDAKEGELLGALACGLPEGAARVDALVCEEAPEGEVVQRDDRAQQPHRAAVPQQAKACKRVGASQQLSWRRRRPPLRVAHCEEGDAGVEHREHEAAAEDGGGAEARADERAGPRPDEEGSSHREAEHLADGLGALGAVQVVGDPRAREREGGGEQARQPEQHDVAVKRCARADGGDRTR
eukprot:640152-Prymnesium_polylepis.1